MGRQRRRAEVATVGYFTDKELDSVLSQCSQLQDSIIFTLILDSGCSISEAQSLQLKDINTTKCTISFPDPINKGKQRTSYISADLAASIAKFLELRKESGQPTDPSTYLLQSRSKPTITTKRIQQIIKEKSEKAGFLDKGTPQVLRYTHVVRAIRSGVPLPAISRQTGLSFQRLVQIAAAYDPENDAADYQRFFTEVVKK